MISNSSALRNSGWIAARTTQLARNPISCVLILCLGIEVLLFWWLCSLGRDAFTAFVWTPDTPGYVGVADQLAGTFTLAPGPRTLGYPLFLALAYLIGGGGDGTYGTYVVIGVQLVLNIFFTWGCWRLLDRIVPAAGLRLRALVTLLFFWAGMGMAFYLMTDFLASLFFGVFLYGMLFWRTPSSAVLSGMALAIATLTRPTFTVFPLVLPIVAYLIGRCTSTVPRAYVVAFMAISFCATGVSVMYQYASYKYLGPSPFLMLRSIEEAIYYGVIQHDGSGIDYGAFQKQFEAKVDKRADRRFGALSPADQETYAKQIFREEFVAHPREIIIHYLKNFIKYLLVPVESIVMRLTNLYLSEQTYLTYVRPVIGLLCLPLWLVSLIPPIGSARNHKMYYLLVMVLLFYVIGLSATTTGSGERIRFPLLVFLLPIMVWNLHRAQGWLQRLVPRAFGARGEALIASGR